MVPFILIMLQGVEYVILVSVVTSIKFYTTGQYWTLSTSGAIYATFCFMKLTQLPYIFLK